MEPISESMMTSTWRSGCSDTGGCGRAQQRAHSDSTAHKAWPTTASIRRWVRMFMGSVAVGLRRGEPRAWQRF